MSIKRGGNGLLLIELFIALMFFSFAAAICLQIFIGANGFSRDASNKSRAVIESQNIAECFKAADGDMDETARLLGCGVQDGGIELWYDDEWNRVEDGGEFQASLLVTQEDYIFTRAFLRVRQAGNTLIEYEVAALEVER